MRPLKVWGHREAGGGQCDGDEAREEGVTKDLPCCWPLVWVQSQQALDELSSGVVDPRGDVVLVALDERVGVLQALGLKWGLPHQQCVAMVTTHTETTCQPVTCRPTVRNSQDAAKGPDVHLKAVALLVEDLRSNVVGSATQGPTKDAASVVCATNPAPPHPPLALSVMFHLGGQPKVTNLDAHIVI